MQTLRTSLVGAALTATLSLTLVACAAGTPPADATSLPAAATQASDSATAAPTAEAATQASDSGATAPTAEVATQVPASAEATAAPTAEASAPVTVAAPKLNLNQVTEDQLLATIPDFSGRMVREFMEYRPYISIQQFRREIGKYVSAEQVAAYEQYVYVPIVVDESDAATLQQLPGVDATDAEALIAGRPYSSNAAFLTALAQYVSADEQVAAAVYLAAE